MKSIHIPDAKAKSSAPVEDAQRLYPEGRPSFAEALLAFPGGADAERDRTPLREVAL